jgi:hypothetical protein
MLFVNIPYGDREMSIHKVDLELLGSSSPTVSGVTFDLENWRGGSHQIIEYFSSKVSYHGHVLLTYHDRDGTSVISAHGKRATSHWIRSSQPLKAAYISPSGRAVAYATESEIVVEYYT